ncbi:hypothetical protein H6778_00820 [Candidatus Nomurabacteria bacterium]|nr:hypothetical protein [Candidatus Nomurabacteria bacterium]
MELEYKTEADIIQYFQDRTGSRSVLIIAQQLISRNNPQEVEIKHIRKLLHSLKAEGVLLVKNEGEDIYHEEFSSTPDRIEKYLEATTRKKNYYDNKNPNREGEVSFDYSSNDHTYFLGQDEELFGIRFSGASQQAIHVYTDHSSIRSLAMVKGASDINDVNLNKKYDGTSRARSPEIGQVVLFRNIYDKYALIQIVDIKMESRGDGFDEVKFKFKILNNSLDDVIAEPENLSSPAVKNLEKAEDKPNLGIIAGGPITAGGDILVGSQKSEKNEMDTSIHWHQKPVGQIIIGLIVTVGGGVILYFLFGV